MNNIAAMVYYLAIHPEWQDKLRSECFSLSDDPKADLDYEMLAKLQSTELAIKEKHSLRSLSCHSG